MTPEYLLAIDQGTTSSRAIVFDTDVNIVSVAQEELPQIYPADGWVEHDPEAIWSTTLSTAKRAFAEAEAKGGKVVAIGITNQRETTVLWERDSGRPIHNAIVWQDRRTAGTCRRLVEDNLSEEVQQRTGLLLDPYFSATKIAWLLDQVEDARKLAEDGKLAFGTVDCFLISRLTGNQVHATDITNAARTSLFNIKDQSWDEALLRIFDVPPTVLPQVLDCAADFGQTAPELFDRAIPILGVAGDQQAATIGQCCFSPGAIKSTYGTGCFVLMNTGDEAFISKNRLLSTIAYRINGKTAYALEGSIFIAGAAVQWLRDGLGIISSAKESEELAKQLTGNNGVYMVPAFTGLGAPYWNPDVRGAIFGIKRSTGPAEIVRAVLESVCYQTHDLFAAMAQDGVKPSSLRIDGGMVTNDWMVQFLADILDLPVDRPKIMETTALGAAYLAGMQAGVLGPLDELAKQWQMEARFEPQITPHARQRLLDGWHDAVQRVIAEV
jgi:glycerol kinase